MVEDASFYRIVKHEQLRHSQAPEARLPVYQCVRSSSQLKGFHFHQNQFVTGQKVSGEFWQAMIAFQIAAWNQKRAVEHRHLTYPLSFNPKLTYYLNTYHTQEYGTPKYPDVKMNFAKTNETFGYEYLLESQSRGVLESIADLYDESEEPYATLARDKPYSTSNKKASKHRSVSSPPEIGLFLFSQLL